MGLKERVYSVLVVSQAERFNTAIKELLAALPFEPVYVGFQCERGGADDGGAKL